MSHLNKQQLLDLLIMVQDEMVEEVEEVEEVVQDEMVET